MKNAITTLRIQNFKSIKDVEMKPRRVNIIIGEPNVGKSNILEAMSLLGGMAYEQTEKFMGSFIRYEETRQLFYDNMLANTIKIESNKDICLLGIGGVGIRGLDEQIKCLFISKDGYEVFLKEWQSMPISSIMRESIIQFVLRDFKGIINRGGVELANKLDCIYTEIDEKGTLSLRNDVNSIHGLDQYIMWKNILTGIEVKYYAFKKGATSKRESPFTFLSPPDGDNLFSVIQSKGILRNEISKMFAPYGLKLMLRMKEHHLEVIKDLEGVIYSYPYSSTADTLQRLIFYLAAIESNDDAVILLEEPEAHSFPVYVSQLGQRIVASRNNQFFVATHSPYLITEILEEMLTDEELRPELAMFVAYYEDYQTKVRQLSDEEVLNIRRDGLDVFYNMDRFIPQR